MQPSACVRKNAALNGFDQVSVFEAAVSSKARSLVLENVGKATAQLADWDGKGRGLHVDCTSLDAFLAARTEAGPDLVKIDVEGHESEVLAGMRATLDARRPVLVIESHGQLGRLVNPLHDAGYSVTVLGSDVRADDAPPFGHLLALPPSSARPR